MAVEEIAWTAMWNDGAVRAVYGSNNYVYKRLHLMKWVLGGVDGNVCRIQPESIHSFMLLFMGIFIFGRKQTMEAKLLRRYGQSDVFTRAIRSFSRR